MKLRSIVVNYVSISKGMVKMVSTKSIIRSSAWIAMLILCIYYPSTAEACPNCKGELHANHLSLAFAGSILLMMSMPFIILISWGIMFVKLRTPSAVR